MRCERCGEELPSVHYFASGSICRSCFERLPASERQELERAAESLVGEGAGQRIVAGQALRCPICGRDRFWKRRTLMNTPGLTFLGVEWANRQAENFVCEKCGHVLWFLPDGPGEPG